MEHIDKMFNHQNSTQNQLSEESYRIMYKIHTELSNTIMKQPEIIDSRNIDEIVRLRNYKSIQLDIRLRIESWNVRRKLFIITLHSGRKVKIDFIFKHVDLPFNFKQIYEKMFIWLSFLDTHSKLECSKTLHVYIFLTDYLKFMPSNLGEELDKFNVNTAFTFSCKRSNEIFIYRKEELLKVFIHETFHSFGLDFSDCNQEFANMIIKNKFTAIDDKKDYNIYESYCEIWAQLINILLITSYINQYIEYTEWKKNINKLLSYERRWSIFQLSKILLHYGFEYTELFNKNEIIYRESKTSVFSYFFLRAIAMVNLDDFLKWSKSNNRHYMYFRNTKLNIGSYCNFLCSNSQNASFIRDLIKSRDYISSLNRNNANAQFVLKTLRMSFFG
jgi:hypothetical protein